MGMKLSDSNQAVLDMYAAIARQSEAMLLAARDGNWDRLCEAEEQCSSLIHDLQRLKKTQSALNRQEKEQHIGYLKKILADDAEIRNITEPRLMKLEEFLRASMNNDRLVKSYGIK